jgi:hypothetical protein
VVGENLDDEGGNLEMASPHSSRASMIAMTSLSWTGYLICGLLVRG